MSMCVFQEHPPAAGLIMEEKGEGVEGEGGWVALGKGGWVG